MERSALWRLSERHEASMRSQRERERALVQREPGGARPVAGGRGGKTIRRSAVAWRPQPKSTSRSTSTARSPTDRGEASDSRNFELLLDIGPDILPRAAITDKGRRQIQSRRRPQVRHCAVIQHRATATEDKHKRKYSKREGENGEGREKEEKKEKRKRREKRRKKEKKEEKEKGYCKCI